MTLKPAHLSYKCTVCTATFGMYKQFENHVYSAHSVVAKRVMDKKAASNASSSSSRSFSHAAAESLLKPLKINDEITIIPQPAKMSSSSRGRKAPCQVCGLVFPLTTMVDHLLRRHVKPLSVKLCKVDRCTTCRDKYKHLKLDCSQPCKAPTQLYKLLSQPNVRYIQPKVETSMLVKQTVVPIYGPFSQVPTIISVLPKCQPIMFPPQNNLHIRVVPPGEETDLYVTPNVVYSSDDSS